jgi:hypothetical protein
MREMNRETGVAVIMVTHDDRLARAADRILLIKNGRMRPLRTAPRQQLVSVAYAFKADTVPDRSLTTDKLADAAVTADKLAPGAVTAAALRDGDGRQVNALSSGLTLFSNPLSPHSLRTRSADTSWLLLGNAGTDPSTNFLGTTDNQPLVVKVNNHRAVRIEYASVGIGGTTYTGVNLLGGYEGNNITSGVVGATIAGGGLKIDSLDYSNRVSGHGGTVGGGLGNLAGGFASTVGGGQLNKASGGSATVGGGGGNMASLDYDTVGGGHGNLASGGLSTVGGGLRNTAGYSSTVAGGQDNTASGLYASVTGPFATIGGGIGNTAGYAATVAGGYQNTASYPYDTVGGGTGNTASGDTASGGVATVSGGQFNTASGTWATIGGGTSNTASGGVATVAGGGGNIAAGYFSFAAGLNAKAMHNGAFVWGDYSQNTDFASTGVNQFLIRAAGGVGINTNNPAGYALNVNGKLLCASLTQTSDARLKTHIATLDNALAQVLALRGVGFEWNQDAYPALNLPAGRQVGFIAQEVEEVLPEVVSTDRLGYKGVAYASVAPVLVEAIKEQQQRMDAQQKQLEAVRAENAQMKRMLASLAARLAQLEAKAATK